MPKTVDEIDFAALEADLNTWSKDNIRDAPPWEVTDHNDSHADNHNDNNS
jgi:hypothetical protein